jgi:nucleoside-diphosphate-sugar epimerase
MKALVTGGGGFLGKAIVRMLIERGDSVRSFSRSPHPELTDLGVEHARGALEDAAAVSEACKGCDIVFHVAAKAGVWGPYDDFHRANVTGTANVIAACREQSIGRLVYTSSPSVVFDGSDMEGVDESVPYPEHFEAFYPQTKAAAERLVLQANDASLSTVALRPHLIWGPGDNHLVPRILERGRKGALRKIGTKPCLVDTIYVDNAAAAHLQAADRLGVGSPVAGKAYFLSQGEPLPVWEVVNCILAAGNLPPVRRTISPRLAYAAGALLETIYRTFSLPGEPRMTRFLARELSTAHWFDLSAARRDFGFDPQVSFDEGMDRLQRSLEQTVKVTFKQDF